MPSRAPSQKKKAPRRRPKKLSQKKKSTVKLIKKVISTMAENKVQTYTINTVAPLVLRSGSSVAANVFPMCPYTGAWTISQGTGQAGRVGNQVRTKKAMLSIQMTPTVYNAVTNPEPTPCFVRIWFVTYKVNPTVTANTTILAGASATFLSAGGTDAGLTGTFQDLQLHVNKDAFTLRGYRTYKIAPSIYEGTGAVPTRGNFGNNDFKLCELRGINITNFLPKIIRWDDVSADPTSFMTSLVIQPVFCTGTAPGSVVTPINFKFSLTYTYEDI